MYTPVALQLFSVKDELKKNFIGTVEKISQMGYSGVEVCRWRLDNVEKAKKVFSQFGLEVTSLHVAIENTEIEQIIDDALALGVKHVFTGVGAEPFSSIEKIKGTAEYFSNIADQTAKHGIFVGIHNHPDEMVMIDGIPAYRRFLNECSENVIWQVDTYWVKLAGLDPVAVIKDIGAQCPSIHLKDGMLAGRQGPLKPLGDGVMNIPEMIKAAGNRTLIVEQDYGEGSMLANAEKSYKHLKSI